MKSDSVKSFVAGQLHLPGDLELRSMFGGHGLYSDGRFFGIPFQCRLYFKTDATTRRACELRGMKAFRPNARQELKNYYEVPADVLEDASALNDWARDAIKLAEE